MAMARTFTHLERSFHWIGEGVILFIIRKPCIIYLKSFDRNEAVTCSPLTRTPVTSGSHLSMLLLPDDAIVATGAVGKSTVRVLVSRTIYVSLDWLCDSHSVDARDVNIFVLVPYVGERTNSPADSKSVAFVVKETCSGRGLPVYAVSVHPLF